MSNRPRRAARERENARGAGDGELPLDDEALLAMCDYDFDKAMELKRTMMADDGGAKGGAGKGGGGKKRAKADDEDYEEPAKAPAAKKRTTAGKGSKAADGGEEARAASGRVAGTSGKAAGGSGAGAGPSKPGKALPNDARALHRHYKANSIQEMAFLQAIEDDAVKSLMKNIRKNYEPYRQGPWHREPWPARAYADLAVNCIAEDCPFEEEIKFIQAKLLTDKRVAPGADEHKDMDVRSPHFGWTCTEVPEPLVEGTDFTEQPCWGMDCFTRTNLVDALSHCKGLIPAGVTDEEQARQIREDFVEFELMPAMNRCGDMGWDIVVACDRLIADARAAGRDTVASVATRLKAIIEGVEAAHGFQRGSEAYMAAFTAEIDPSSIEALDALKAADRRDFRAHPKGMGIVCTRPGGVKAGTLVAEWAGEVYPPWRWFEKQDAFKRKNPHAPLPDFYNIMLERPRDDSMGYDVLFVDSSVKGNFTSRMSHSCTPNCHTMPMCAGGRVCIAFVAIRDIREGEELTWDYNSVTESEKEFKEAICLCGTRGCRGSFLHYSNSKSFQEVLSNELLFLQRTAMIVRGVMEPFTQEDEEALGKLGIKTSALAKAMTVEAETRDMVPRDKLPPGIPRSAYVEVLDGDIRKPGGPVVMPKITPLPDWVRKWAALVARFIEKERAELPALLVKNSREYMQMLMRNAPKEEEVELTLGDFDQARNSNNSLLPKKTEATYTHEYSPEEADEVAAGVRENRIQNLVITIDKVRYFLTEAERVWGQTIDQSPLRELEEDEVIAHLWTGTYSIVKKFAARTIPVTCPGLAARGRKKQSEPDYVTDTSLVATAEDGEGWEHAKAMRDLIHSRKPQTAAEASQAILDFAGLLRATGQAHHAAGYDALMMYGKTKTWFTVWTYEKGLKSQPVTSWWDTTAPADTLLLKDISNSPGPRTRKGGAAGPSAPSVGPSPIKPVGATKPAGATPLQSPSKGSAQLGRQLRLARELAMGDPDLRKKYTPHYVWGQMSAWMKQTIYDPSASLSADRRGTLSLPDPETCYQGAFFSYSRPHAKVDSDRNRLLDMIERDPNAQWPTSFIFRFQNPTKIYGSPQFDWALAHTRGEDYPALKTLLRELKATQWQYKPRTAKEPREKKHRGDGEEDEEDEDEDPEFVPDAKVEAAITRRSGRERLQAPLGFEVLSHLVGGPESAKNTPRKRRAPALAPALDPTELLALDDGLPCCGCGGFTAADGNEMLLCDGCDIGCWHQQCLKPPLAAIPEGEWFCPTCVAVKKYKEEQEQMKKQQQQAPTGTPDKRVKRAAAATTQARTFSPLVPPEQTRATPSKRQKTEPAADATVTIIVSPKKTPSKAPPTAAREEELEEKVEKLPLRRRPAARRQPQEESPAVKVVEVENTNKRETRRSKK